MKEKMTMSKDFNKTITVDLKAFLETEELSFKNSIAEIIDEYHTTGDSEKTAKELADMVKCSTARMFLLYELDLITLEEADKLSDYFENLLMETVAGSIIKNLKKDTVDADGFDWEDGDYKVFVHRIKL